MAHAPCTACQKVSGFLLPPWGEGGGEGLEGRGGEGRGGEGSKRGLEQEENAVNSKIVVLAL